MADVTYTIPINVHSPHEHIGYSLPISSDLEAGNDVVLTPLAKGISVNTEGSVMIQEPGSVSGYVRRLIPGKIHHVDIKKVYAVAEAGGQTDAGLEIHVYGD